MTSQILDATTSPQTTQRRIRWYQDVDGPLNPWQAKNPRKHWEDYAKHTVFPDPTGEPDLSYRLWFSPTLGDSIRALVDAHDVDLVWATTWGPHIDTIVDLAHLGRDLRVLDTADFEEVSFFGNLNCEKFPAVVNDAGNDPVIWIDDTIGKRDKYWAKDRNSEGFPTLLIVPSPSVGVSKADLEKIEQFLIEASEKLSRSNR